MVKPLNAISRKESGTQDNIAFDNSDDTLEDIPKQAQGYEESLVSVDSPDDFNDEGEK